MYLTANLRTNTELEACKTECRQEMCKSVHCTGRLTLFSVIRLGPETSRDVINHEMKTLVQVLRTYQVFCTMSRYNLTHLLVSRGDWSALKASLDQLTKKENFCTLPNSVDRSTCLLGISSTCNLSCYPHSSYQFPGEQVSTSSSPNPSIARIRQDRSRPTAFVPMSLLFTSVLTADIVGSFRNTKS